MNGKLEFGRKVFLIIENPLVGSGNSPFNSFHIHMDIQWDETFIYRTVMVFYFPTLSPAIRQISKRKCI